VGLALLLAVLAVGWSVVVSYAVATGLTAFTLLLGAALALFIAHAISLLLLLLLGRSATVVVVVTALLVVVRHFAFSLTINASRATGELMPCAFRSSI
jgi:hypothetical protein